MLLELVATNILHIVLQVTEKKLANLVRNYVRVLDVFAKINYDTPEYTVCINVRDLNASLENYCARCSRKSALLALHAITTI